MKRIYLITVICSFLISAAVIYAVASNASQQEDVATEEYAIVELAHAGKTISIKTTIGNSLTIESRIKRDDLTISYAEVMKELNKVNSMGFEIVSVTQSHNVQQVSSYPVTVFFFRKKTN